MTKGSDVSRHSRGEGNSSLIYPVIARRSGGLSLGINLFPDSKTCSFNCPYCEVLPFSSTVEFSPEKLEAQMEQFFHHDREEPGAVQLPLRDICISGNGEPTLSPWLGEVLEICSQARMKYPEALKAKLVLITNSTGFLDPGIVDLLHTWQRNAGLSIWAKLDAGTPEWFALMSGSEFSLPGMCEAISDFSRKEPVVIQTMLCALGENFPGQAEAEAYADRLNAMIACGAAIDAVDFYTIARPCVSDEAKPISASSIIDFMDTVQLRLAKPISLKGFDSRGQIGKAMRGGTASHD
ncbi:MAG: hypothetical protein LLF89_04930 [Spirochaetaceae bacterium]|nr:hypothetical protein [Spirochaetaceae bacterium]